MLVVPLPLPLLLLLLLPFAHAVSLSKKYSIDNCQAFLAASRHFWRVPGVPEYINPVST